MARRKTSEMKDYFNELLSDAGAALRVVEYQEGQIAILNTGEIIEKRGIGRLRKLCHSADGRKRLDDLFSTDPKTRREAARALKQVIGRKGATTTLARHRETLIAPATENLRRAREYGRAGSRGRRAWNKGLTKHNSPVYAKMSRDRTGDGNPMYGTSPSIESRMRQSKHMKEMISSGNFTPHVTNSRTRKRLEWTGVHYRSSWELVFARLHPQCEFEELRIPYEWRGKEHIYLVDFIDRASRIVYEIKPSAHLSDERNVEKRRSLAKWCAENCYEMITVGNQAMRVMLANLRDDDPIFDLMTPNMKRGLRRLNETHFTKND